MTLSLIRSNNIKHHHEVLLKLMKLSLIRRNNIKHHHEVLLKEADSRNERSLRHAILTLTLTLTLTLN